MGEQAEYESTDRGGEALPAPGDRTLPGHDAALAACLADLVGSSHRAADVLDAVVDHWRDRAQGIDDARRKGWKSAGQMWRNAAGLLAGEALTLRSGENHAATRLPPELHIDVTGLTAGADVPTVDPLAMCGENGSDLLYVSDPRSATCSPCIAAYGEQMPSDPPAPYDIGSDRSGEPRGVLNEPGIAAIFPEAFTHYEGLAMPDMPRVVDAEAPPPARPRMSFAAVRTRGMARRRGADHRSVSQVTSFEQCGVQYALSDLARPAWWNVGGTAVHRWCELHVMCLDRLWSDVFINAIASEVKKSGVPMAQWMAAKKGAEGYDWWRVEGERMTRNFTRWFDEQLAAGWKILELRGVLFVEYEFSVPVGNIKVDGIMDLVLVKGDVVRIIDYKSSASAPLDTFQLEIYGHALARILANEAYAAPMITAQHLMLRTGETKGSIDQDVTTLRPFEELSYRVATMDTAEVAGLYMPNRSFSCFTCGVSDLCPAAGSLDAQPMNVG